MSIKILSINIWGLPNGYSSNLIKANVFQDYDAIVIKPDNHDRIYENIDYTSTSNEKLTRKGGFSLWEVNGRRRIESRALLERGGVLVCFLEPMVFVNFDHKDDKQDLALISNYDWLFRRDELHDELGNINYSCGNTIDQLDNAHPFFDYLNTKPSWSAYVDVNDCKSWKILASAFGTHIVSLSKRIGAGHIIFIPSYYDSVNGKLLEQCINKLLKGKEVILQPAWAQEIVVQGQQDIRGKIEELNKKILSFEKERDKLIEENDNLERWKWLLYAKGKHQLQPIVQEALRLIGFKVEDQPDKDSDGLVISEYGCALLEVAGSTGTIRIEKFGELITNVGNFIKQKGQKVGGILIGNPFCEELIDNRPPKDSQKQPFAKELLESAEKQDITVLLSADLYELVTRILSDKISDNQKLSIRQKIFEANGLLRLSQLL